MTTDVLCEVYARVRQYFLFLGILPWDYDEEADASCAEASEISSVPIPHPAYEFGMEFENTLMYAKFSPPKVYPQCITMALSRDMRVAT
ncbi:MAG: hypothetical protein AAFV97_04010 [Bacteroidota bacterium]